MSETYSKHEILRESPIYQEILEEGREEEREVALKAFRHTIVAVVAERFPKLVRQTKQYVETLYDLALLQQLIIDVAIAKTSQEVQALFVASIRSENKGKNIVDDNE